MHSTNASSADVMRLVSALNESWTQILTSAQESQTRFRQSFFEAKSPAEAAAAYGSWCLAVAGAAMQENQRLVEVGMRVLAERAKQSLAAPDSSSGTPTAGQPPSGKGSAS
jgi:hypothetical protein